MALTELPTAGLTSAGRADEIAVQLAADLEIVDRRLEMVRAAIDEARRNGWRRSHQLGADLEEYLAAVQLSQRFIRRPLRLAGNPWAE
jgi:hypothetical protein